MDLESSKKTKEPSFKEAHLFDREFFNLQKAYKK